MTACPATSTTGSRLDELAETSGKIQFLFVQPGIHAVEAPVLSLVNLLQPDIPTKLLQKPPLPCHVGGRQRSPIANINTEINSAITTPGHMETTPSGSASDKQSFSQSPYTSLFYLGPTHLDLNIVESIKLRHYNQPSNRIPYRLPHLADDSHSAQEDIHDFLPVYLTATLKARDNRNRKTSKPPAVDQQKTVPISHPTQEPQISASTRKDHRAPTLLDTLQSVADSQTLQLHHKEQTTRTNPIKRIPISLSTSS
ncbi:hypothetical protein ACTXT7_017073 [Hymenolepis weldensis]